MDERQTNLELAHDLHRVSLVRRKTDSQEPKKTEPEPNNKAFYLAATVAIVALIGAAFVMVHQVASIPRYANAQVTK